MKYLIISVLCLNLIACQQSESVDKTLITTTFKAFNEANINQDGQKIYKLTDSESHKYYEDLLPKIIEYDSAMVSNLNITDKINVLSVRSVIEDSVILKLDAKELLIRMYSDVNVMDPIKIDAIKNTGLKDIHINQDLATAQLTTNGEPFNPKAEVKFIREGDGWKYTIVSMIDYTEDIMQKIKTENGLSDIELILSIFADPNAQKKRIKDLDEIWNPINK